MKLDVIEVDDVHHHIRQHSSMTECGMSVCMMPGCNCRGRKFRVTPGAPADCVMCLAEEAE